MSKIFEDFCRIDLELGAPLTKFLIECESPLHELSCLTGYRFLCYEGAETSVIGRRGPLLNKIFLIDIEDGKDSVYKVVLLMDPFVPYVEEETSVFGVTDNNLYFNDLPAIYQHNMHRYWTKLLEKANLEVGHMPIINEQIVKPTLVTTATFSEPTPATIPKPTIVKEKEKERDPPKQVVQRVPNNAASVVYSSSKSREEHVGFDLSEITGRQPEKAQTQPVRKEKERVPEKKKPEEEPDFDLATARLINQLKEQKVTTYDIDDD